MQNSTVLTGGKQPDLKVDASRTAQRLQKCYPYREITVCCWQSCVPGKKSFFIYAVVLECKI